MSKSYLLRVKLGNFERASDITPPNPDALNIEHAIYVPGRYVFGPFIDVIRGYEFARERFFYYTTPEKLKRFKQRIHTGSIEIVKELNLPESQLEALANAAKATIKTRKQLNKIFRKVSMRLPKRIYASK